VPLWLQYPGSGTTSFECQDNVYQSLHSIVDRCCLLLPALDTKTDGEGIIVQMACNYLQPFIVGNVISFLPNAHCAGHVILVVVTSKSAYTLSNCVQLPVVPMRPTPYICNSLVRIEYLSGISHLTPNRIMFEIELSQPYTR
jgi:hypothetical protein